MNRENAEKDYTQKELEMIYALSETITEEEKQQLIDTIIVKTQGFINGNIKEGDENPVSVFKNLLELYKGTDKNKLRENIKHFLTQIMPVCEEYGINMSIHPDDPPLQVLGLPRIVTNEEDIQWILRAVDSPCNGLTFCAGSLSAGIHNDVTALASKFVSRTHFVHLRSTDVFSNGNFVEADHLAGRANLIDLIRIFEKNKPNLPMRVDHGPLMPEDKNKNYNPGYSFYGRMYALAQMSGVMATVRNELDKGLDINTNVKLIMKN